MRVGGNRWCANDVAASSEARLARVALPPNLTEQLEAVIDEFDDQLPPLKNFILPGGEGFGLFSFLFQIFSQEYQRCQQPLKTPADSACNVQVRRTT